MYTTRNKPSRVPKDTNEVTGHAITNEDMQSDKLLYSEGEEEALLPHGENLNYTHSQRA